jgi:hypothetical protein
MLVLGNGKLQQKIKNKNKKVSRKDAKKRLCVKKN